MRLIHLSQCVLLAITLGCVDDRSSSSDGGSAQNLAPGGANGGTATGAGGTAANSSSGSNPTQAGGANGTDNTDPSDPQREPGAVEMRGGAQSMSTMPEPGDDTPSSGGAMNASSEPAPEPPPPADAGRSPCDRFCERMEMCLYSACPPVAQVPIDQACRGWCRGDSEDWLNESASLSCDEYNQRIYAFSPETRALCAERDAGQSLCDEVCEFGNVCGVDNQECRTLCDNLNQGQQLCFAGAAQVEDCQRFFGCFGRVQEQGGNICENICGREAICVFNTCAPGTINEGYTNTCIEQCEQDRPSGREAQRRFQQTCGEVVNRIRGENAEIDARCDNQDENICEALCDDRVTMCMGVERDQCLMDCQRWDRSNHICLAQAGDCEEIQACFVSSEVQERCRTQCDKLQGCLEEACPPQLIPARLTDNCTADCFRDEPTAQEIEEFQGLSCREVREFVLYRENRELRPLCEGNRDFRPAPDECAAFCDGALGDCIIGGRRVCLAACASISRDQYECALTAEGECGAIDRCLSD